MKVKIFAISILPVVAIIMAFLLSVLPGTVLAQEPVPPPYAGLKNPVPWDNTAAQEAGKSLFQKSCTGCHGAKGNTIATADFSKADFRTNLEGKPDFYFWTLSEGRLTKGMPPFKASLSEEQRWQALSYLWSLAAAPGGTQTPTPAVAEGISLTVTAPKEGTAGQPLTFTAVLKDKDGKPIKEAAVKFLAKVSFLNGGDLMEIGEAVTDGTGTATLQYTPRFDGDVQLVARYQTVEANAAMMLAPAPEPFYHTEVGIKLPSIGKEVFIGPKSAEGLNEQNRSPNTAFRLPAGVSLFLLPTITIMLIWFTYFRVMFQVFRIPITSQISDTNTRLIPMMGLTIVVLIGLTLLLMFVTGPYSHWHIHH